MRVYKIKTDLTKERDELLTSNFTREETKKIFSFFENGNRSYDMFDENEFMCVYYLCNTEALDYIKYLFYKYEVKFDVDDITDDFLIGKVDISDTHFQNYLLENLNVDTILDKINEFGFESLTDIDRKILDDKK